MRGSVGGVHLRKQWAAAFAFLAVSGLKPEGDPTVHLWVLKRQKKTCFARVSLMSFNLTNVYPIARILLSNGKLIVLHV